MNKKLIKTIASITCGLGIASSIPLIATSCEDPKIDNYILLNHCSDATQFMVTPGMSLHGEKTNRETKDYYLRLCVGDKYGNESDKEWVIEADHDTVSKLPQGVNFSVIPESSATLGTVYFPNISISKDYQFQNQVTKVDILPFDIIATHTNDDQTVETIKEQFNIYISESYIPYMFMDIEVGSSSLFKTNNAWTGFNQEAISDEFVKYEEGSAKPTTLFFPASYWDLLDHTEQYDYTLMDITEVSSAAFTYPRTMNNFQIEHLIFENNKSTGIKYVGANAFSQQATLKSINFPSTLEKVDSNAFKQCDNITEIIINDDDNNLYKDYQNIFPKNCFSSSGNNQNSIVRIKGGKGYTEWTKPENQRIFLNYLGLNHETGKWILDFEE